MAEPKSQGLCDVTLTERFENPVCSCRTYPGNLGPCKVFELGFNKRGACVYCDHGKPCHPVLVAGQWQFAPKETT